MPSGIYKIQNSITNKVYIGSSKDIEKRWKQHIYELDRGIHCNKKLQSSWAKHGKENFYFEVLQEVEEKFLTEIEQEFIDAYEAWKTGYNIAAQTSARRITTSSKKRKTIILDEDEKKMLAILAAQRGLSEAREIGQLIREEFARKKLKLLVE